MKRDNKYMNFNKDTLAEQLNARKNYLLNRHNHKKVKSDIAEKFDDIKAKNKAHPI